MRSASPRQRCARWGSPSAVATLASRSQAAQHRVASSTYGYASGEAKLVDPGKKPFQSFATGPLTVAKGASHQVKLTIGPMSHYKAMSAPGQYIASAIINPNKSVPESNLNNNGVGGYVSDPCFGK